jgi:hypothetical protein
MVEATEHHRVHAGVGVKSVREHGWEAHSQRELREPCIHPEHGVCPVAEGDGGNRAVERHQGHELMSVWAGKS